MFIDRFVCLFVVIRSRSGYSSSTEDESDGCGSLQSGSDREADASEYQQSSSSHLHGSGVGNDEVSSSEMSRNGRVMIVNRGRWSKSEVTSFFPYHNCLIKKVVRGNFKREIRYFFIEIKDLSNP